MSKMTESGEVQIYQLHAQYKNDSIFEKLRPHHICLHLTVIKSDRF